MRVGSPMVVVVAASQAKVQVFPSTMPTQLATAAPLGATRSGQGIGEHAKVEPDHAPLLHVRDSKPLEE